MVQSDQIVESGAFAPADMQRGLGREPAINPAGLAFVRPFGLSNAPDALDGQPMQWVIRTSDAQYVYYLDRPIDNVMTPSAFLAAGGLQLEKETRTDPQSFAEYLLATVGQRAVPIAVGPYSGVLTWADPTREGVRSHNLYWSDGASNFALIAVRSPEALVNLGRHLVCPGS